MVFNMMDVSGLGKPKTACTYQFVAVNYITAYLFQNKLIRSYLSSFKVGVIVCHVLYGERLDCHVFGHMSSYVQNASRGVQTSLHF